MKLNRQEYDLIYDAFQYMYFKMTKEQKILAVSYTHLRAHET